MSFFKSQSEYVGIFTEGQTLKGIRRNGDTSGTIMHFEGKAISTSVNGEYGFLITDRYKYRINLKNCAVNTI